MYDFAAAYTARNGSGGAGTDALYASSDATFTIEPRPRDTIPGSAARVSRVSATMCSRISSSASSAVSSMNGLYPPNPAQFTTKSSDPLASITCSTARSSSLFVRSAAITVASTPASSRSRAASSSSRSRLRATRITSRPSRASRSA